METKKKSIHPIKVVSLQILPVHKDVAKSMQKAESILSEISEKDNVDILVLSEMVFTGYKFANIKDIEPYLEKSGEGPTYEWCKKQALRLKCWVFCGYPEIMVDEDNETRYFNSQLVVNPAGDFVKSYKKHFLYDTDKTWAEPGPAFDTMDLIHPRNPEVSIKIGHGICMDINPWEFKSEFEKFEFGTYHRDQKCQLIIFSSAWLDPNTYPSDKKATDDTINYWANRLIPIIEDADNKDPCYFVCSNRVGTELGENYMGSSVILKVRPNVAIVKNLSKKEQGYMIQTLFV